MNIGAIIYATAASGIVVGSLLIFSLFRKSFQITSTVVLVLVQLFCILHA